MIEDFDETRGKDKRTRGEDLFEDVWKKGAAMIRPGRRIVITAMLAPSSIRIIVIRAFPTFLPDWDLDALRRKTLAELCTVADAGELLCRVDLEDVAKDRGEDGGFAHLDGGVALLVSLGLDIDEREPQSKWMFSVRRPIAVTCFGAQKSDVTSSADLPERPLCPYAQILHDEPNTNLVLGIVQPESASGTVPNEIPGKHPLDARTTWRA